MQILMYFLTVEMSQHSTSEVVALTEGGSDREKSYEEKFSDNFYFCICFE